MKDKIDNFLKKAFIFIVVWFIFCQLHVIYHYAVTAYRTEWIVGRTQEEVEMRYGEPDYREGIRRSIYCRPDCLNKNSMEGFYINALRVIPFYSNKKYYMVLYDNDGIAYWAGYRNRDNAGD